MPGRLAALPSTAQRRIQLPRRQVLNVFCAHIHSPRGTCCRNPPAALIRTGEPPSGGMHMHTGDDMEQLE